MKKVRFQNNQGVAGTCSMQGVENAAEQLEGQSGQDCSGSRFLQRHAVRNLLQETHRPDADGIQEREGNVETQ